jgi:hypothetical protein
MKTGINVDVHNKQKQGTRGALSRALFSPALIIVTGLIVAPATMQADCMPSGVGTHVPFTMVTTNAASSDPQGHKVVSYTAGVLTNVGYPGGVGYQTNASTQLFNDRYAYASLQPFDIHQPDSISLTIQKGYLQSGTPIYVWLKLNSWGNATFSFTGHCDASTNLLYGSFNNDTMVVIGFGTPY